MGNYCSNNGHAYKLTYKTQPFSRPNEFGNFIGIEATLDYQLFQYQCVNCNKIKCHQVHKNTMNIAPELDYDVVEHICHETPTQLLFKLQKIHPTATWIPVKEEWLQQ